MFVLSNFTLQVYGFFAHDVQLDELFSIVRYNEKTALYGFGLWEIS